MKDWNTDHDPRGVHREKHSQLVQDVPRTRLGIRPNTVSGEVIDYSANERDCPGIDQPHGKEAGQKIHNSKIQR